MLETELQSNNIHDIVYVQLYNIENNSMNYVVDTSIIISVITDGAHKKNLIKLTDGAELTAPSTLHWEVGNAFSALMKRRRVNLKQSQAALDAYRDIPLRFSDIELDTALELSAKLNIYAYDAYVIGCALKHKYPILTLDKGLIEAAQKAGAAIMEVKS
jgi:predicted nucleic acid-binding protein